MNSLSRSGKGETDANAEVRICRTMLAHPATVQYFTAMKGPRKLRVLNPAVRWTLLIVAESVIAATVFFRPENWLFAFMIAVWPLLLLTLQYLVRKQRQAFLVELLAIGGICAGAWYGFRSFQSSALAALCGLSTGTIWAVSYHYVAFITPPPRCAAQRWIDASEILTRFRRETEQESTTSNGPQ